MNNILEYKGYHAKVEYDVDSAVLFGKIEGINDLVNFESDSTETIVQEFHNAVDDYLLFCEEVGKDPDKEYKGLFNVRISPKLHKELATVAFKTGESLNSIVEISIEHHLASLNIYEDYDNSQSDTATFSNIIEYRNRIKNDNQKFQINSVSDLEEM